MKRLTTLATGAFSRRKAPIPTQRTGSVFGFGADAQLFLCRSNITWQGVRQHSSRSASRTFPKAPPNAFSEWEGACRPGNDAADESFSAISLGAAHGGRFSGGSHYSSRDRNLQKQLPAFVQFLPIVRYYT